MAHRLNDLKSAMGKMTVQSACFGLMTFEEAMTDEQYKELKLRRKNMYRERFYSTLTEDDVRQRKIDKTRKILLDLRQQWFKATCSGQCMDFNCIKCEEIRKPLKQELDQKEIELTNLETPV